MRKILIYIHDDNHFHHPHVFKLASGTHTEWILNREREKRNISENSKEIISKTNFQSQLNSRFTPALDLKTGTPDLIPKFKIYRGTLEKLPPLGKNPIRSLANQLVSHLNKSISTKLQLHIIEKISCHIILRSTLG